MKNTGNRIYRNLKRVEEKIYKVFMVTMIVVYSMIQGNKPVSAAGPFGTSIFATGTKNLATDIGTYLLILAPISGSLLGVYFFIRRQAADEMDQKKCCARKCA